MGVYDTIYFKCPKCGEEINAQSKSGECLLKNYPNTDVPISVAYDANRHAPFKCDCGAVWLFDTSQFRLPKKVNLNIVEYKESLYEEI